MLASYLGVIILLICAILFRQYQKKTNRKYVSNKMLYGKTAIITGGTAGMGLEVAKDLARRGSRVIVACPFEEEGVEAERVIKKESSSHNVVYKYLNLASLQSVRSFANNILNEEDRVDIVMNNAGVYMPDNPQTEDGLSYIMQVNYYGHFLLTLLLIPLLRKSEPSRVVCLTSVAHILGKIDSNKPNWHNVITYNNSKFSFIPFSRELTRRLKDCNVLINCADPGLVGTRIFDTVTDCKKFVDVFVWLLKTLFKTPQEGAQTAIYLAVDDEVANISGEYFRNCRLSKAKTSAYDDDVASKLWSKSVQHVKLTEDELKECFAN